MSGGFNNPIIGGGGGLVYPSIHSPNFVHNVSGWTINKDGSAEFDQLTLRGTFNGANYIINANGEFFYSGTPAANNLIFSIASAAGTDSFGNAYFAESTDYNDTGVVGPSRFIAVNVAAAQISFYGAASEAGPWTLVSNINGTSTGRGIFIENGGVAGQYLVVEGTAAGPTFALIQSQTASAGDAAFGALVAATDLHERWKVLASGEHFWSDGTNAPDASFHRLAAGSLSVKTADLSVESLGRGLRMREGANCKQGTATLAGGTVVVANTSVTAVSRIILTPQDNNTTGAVRVSARTANTSFTITSNNPADSGVVGYLIFEPA